MPNLIDIRRRIKSVKNTQQITKAMKMVAASRLRRASESAMNARPYAEKIKSAHHSIANTTAALSGPLYKIKDGKTLVVVVTSDKGLCGAFNTNVIRAAEDYITEIGIDQATVLPIGKKANQYFRKQPVDSLGGYVDFFRSIGLILAEAICDQIVESFTKDGFGKVVLFYNRFKNVLVQVVTQEHMLPLVHDEGLESQSLIDHLAEPSLDEILNQLSPQLLVTQIYQALLESIASENAARMTAMDAATSNARDMIDKLTLDMNKARQAAITKELIEIVSGAAAL